MICPESYVLQVHMQEKSLARIQMNRSLMASSTAIYTTACGSNGTILDI